MQKRILLIFGIFLTLASALVYADEPISDPLEPVNRKIFIFNDTLDEYVAEPVATGYDWAVPDDVQNCVKNFFRNLRFPIQVVSNLAQFRFGAAAEDTGRFLINSTVGVAGLFDVAPWEYERQDIGTALGAHGVPEGPYLVLPLLGPSNVRDFSGSVVAFFLDPLFWLYRSDAFDSDTDFIIAASLTTLELVNTRARYLDVFADMKADSVDYYLSQQSFYTQYRRGLIAGDSADDDWYEDDFGDEDYGDEDFE